MPPTSKRARFEDCCQVCEELTTHLFRHMRRAHLPWYLDPASACIDCHMSAGTREDLHNVHGTHQGFTGETMIRGWFLLINGLFLFLSQQIGISSPIELLGCAVVRELSPHLLRFSEDELFFSQRIFSLVLKSWSGARFILGVHVCSPNSTYCLDPSRINDTTGIPNQSRGSISAQMVHQVFLG